MRNARTHSKKQIRQIADSIVAFGFVNPILVDEVGVIVACHGRHAAARLLELKQVPVIELRGLSEAKRRALALADNKIAENAGWDRELLALELPELAEILVEDGLDIYWTAVKSSATFFTSAAFFNGEPFPQGYIFEQGQFLSKDR
jgi:ParB-like chromosome segregation protein Spo0J